MSELLWVAVPNGLQSPTKALLSVLVVPRLAAGIISDFGLEDWPAVLAEATFSMRTRTSVGETIANRRPQYVARARSDVWAAFFGGDAAIINDYEAKTNPVPAVSPTHDDAQAVAGTYRSVTRVAADPANNANSAIRSALSAWAAPEPAQPPGDTELPTFTIPDFHSTVSTLREHPTVLVDLGLVFELIVDVADINLGTAAAGRQLSIRCVDPPFLQTLVTSPWTRYDLTGTDFRPAPAPGSNSGIRNGMLDLSTRPRSLANSAGRPDPLGYYDLRRRRRRRQPPPDRTRPCRQPGRCRDNAADAVGGAGVAATQPVPRLRRARTSRSGSGSRVDDRHRAGRRGPGSRLPGRH